MSEEEQGIFQELDEFSRELREEREYYGYPYNVHNPRYNLNLISSDTIDELIHEMMGILNTAFEYKMQGWELTEPVRFGKIQLHYNREGEPHTTEENDE